jgi:hypothetical protein
MSHIDRDLELAGESSNTTAVIGMLMGYQNRIQLMRIDMESLKAPRGFSYREATVDHHYCVIARYQRRVTLTAAAKRRKAH